MNVIENLKMSMFRVMYGLPRITWSQSITCRRRAKRERGGPSPLPTSLDVVLKARMAV